LGYFDVGIPEIGILVNDNSISGKIITSKRPRTMGATLLLLIDSRYMPQS